MNFENMRKGILAAREKRETNQIELWIPIPCAGEASSDTRRQRYGVERHLLWCQTWLWRWEIGKLRRV